MKSLNSPDRQAQQTKLLAYLDQFGKQISNRKNSNALEEQLSSLSRAYNQAQEKLLQTQRALMGESIMLEKQRSVIEIYKHIIREDMEDDGILQFIQDLQQNEEKKGIYQELESIRLLLSQKKRKQYQKGFHEQRTIKELRKQVSRLHQQRSCINDQSLYVNQENQQLRGKFESANKQVQTLKYQINKLTASLQSLKEQLQKQRQKNSELKRQVIHLKQQQINLIKRQEELLSLHHIIDSSFNKQKNKENININRENDSKYIYKNDLRPLHEKLQQLVKYKHQYKKIKQNHIQSQFVKKQNGLLKLFISEEALELFKQFQKQKLQCIESQLRNLAVIEKNNNIRMKQCEREVWKYKLQLMKEDESQQIIMSQYHNSLNKSICSHNFGSKMGAAMVQSLPPVLQGSSSIRNISQFIQAQQF